MRKLALVLAMIFASLSVPVEADDYVQVRPASLPLTGGTITGTPGPELAPAIGAGTGYTCGAGWNCSVAGVLNKNADGVGTVAPNPAITAVVGSTYRVLFTVAGLTVGSVTYTMGGTAGTAALAADGVHEHYVTAGTTGSLIITPTSTSRFTITVVSVRLMSAGDLEVEGDATVRSTLTVDGQIVVARGTASAPAIRSTDADSGFCWAYNSPETPGICSNGNLAAWANNNVFTIDTAFQFGSTNVFLTRTLTPAGTTGAQTINKHGGSVNFAAAATSLVVTNTYATTTSLIFLTPQANDATCKSFNVTRASGSFTINASAACTAETAVAFWVTN